MQFVAGLLGTLLLFVAMNVWYITICLLLYLIWRELRMLRRQ